MRTCLWAKKSQITGCSERVMRLVYRSILRVQQGCCISFYWAFSHRSARQWLCRAELSLAPLRLLGRLARVPGVSEKQNPNRAVAIATEQEGIRRNSIWSSHGDLMARLPTAVAHYQARYVHRFKITEGQAFQACQIGIIPAGIRCADESAGLAVIGQDYAIISEPRDDDRCLRAGSGASRGGDRSLQPVDLSGSARHGTSCRGRRL
jgi:hypothetical protein